MTFSQHHDNWTINWKFHFHTSQRKDIARIFAKITERAGVNLQLASSGIREARPGSWVRADIEFSGTLGDAVVAVLDAASKFGAHVNITGPTRFGEKEISFSGWMHECSHSELAAVEFEMNNSSQKPPADTLVRGPA